MGTKFKAGDRVIYREEKTKVVLVKDITPYSSEQYIVEYSKGWNDSRADKEGLIRQGYPIKYHYATENQLSSWDGYAVGDWVLLKRDDNNGLNKDTIVQLLQIDESYNPTGAFAHDSDFMFVVQNEYLRTSKKAIVRLAQSIEIPFTFTTGTVRQATTASLSISTGIQQQQLLPGQMDEKVNKIKSVSVELAESKQSNYL